MSITRPLTSPLTSAITRAITTPGTGAWTPALWFLASEQGIWLDPSDMATMWQDSAGTTPVTAVEQPVGLALDKRLGLVRGPELVTNGAGDTASGWTYPGGAGGSIASAAGELVHTSATTLLALADRLSHTPINGLTVGVSYRLDALARNISDAVGCRISVAAAATASDTTGTYVDAASGSLAAVGLQFTATATTMYLRLIARAGTSGGKVAAKSVSIKALPGNHASQATTAQKPVLSARKNKLLGTEVLATQNVTVLAAQHVLSFYGTGTVTLSGVSTAGPLVGTGVGNRVSLTFTPTAGTLTLTVSGSVTQAQLEVVP